MNARQLEVLKWIVDGCPDGVQTGNTYKTTAVALKGRRLVTISRKGGVWSAEATEAGRHYTANGAYPDGHWAVQAAPRRHARMPIPSPQAGEFQQMPRPAPAPKASKPRPVEDMLDVLLGGGEIEVEYAETRRYNTLVASARRSSRVPNEKMIVFREGNYRDRGVVSLVDKPEWMVTSPEPIPVAATLASVHPAVAELRNVKGIRLKFKPEPRQRALRILNAVAKASTSRGWTVTAPNARDPYLKAADMVVEAEGHTFNIHVTEQSDRVPHIATAKELREHEKYSWMTIPTHDKVPNGNLTIEIVGRWTVSQSKFSDTKTVNLEDRVGHIVREFGLRVEKANEARGVRDRENAARMAQWERVRAQAEVDVVEDHRARVLIKRAERWKERALIGDYVAELQRHVMSLEGDDRSSAEEWLVWATARHERLGEMGAPVGMPNAPQVTAEALKPFMRGLSVNPPEMRTWF